MAKRTSSEMEQQIKDEAQYFISSETTIRGLGKAFGISKTSAHLDMTSRLLRIDKNLYNKVQVVLKTNLAERAIRGGKATKALYSKMRS